MTADLLSLTFSALADPTRRAILSRLVEGPASVKELSEPFAMSGPAITKHLRVLERAGLISRGREAQWRPCRLQAGPIKQVVEWAGNPIAASGMRASIDWMRIWNNSRPGSRPMTTRQNEFGVTTFSTPSDTEIAMTRVFDAPRRLVFDAWTNPSHLPHWMLGPGGWTMPVCEIDLRVGGGWRFVWHNDNGSEMAMSGVYREIVPPEKIVTTESWGGDWPETVNTLILTETAGKTTMTQTVRYVSEEARDAALKTGMKHGVTASFNRLEAYLQAMA